MGAPTTACFESAGQQAAQGLRIATRPRPLESQVIEKVIAPSGMLLWDD